MDVLRLKPSRIDPLTEQAVRQFLALLVGRYDVDGAVVFGSRAHGTHLADSDADVAVILKGQPQRVLPVALAMADIAYDVLLETGVTVCPLPVWVDQWAHPQTHSNPALLQTIAKEGVRL